MQIPGVKSFWISVRHQVSYGVDHPSSASFIQGESMTFDSNRFKFAFLPTAVLLLVGCNDSERVANQASSTNPPAVGAAGEASGPSPSSKTDSRSSLSRANEESHNEARPIDASATEAADGKERKTDRKGEDRPPESSNRIERAAADNSSGDATDTSAGESASKRKRLTLPPVAEPTGKTGTEPGDTVMEITGEDIDGEEFALSDYEGKVIMLDFWGDW